MVIELIDEKDVYIALHDKIKNFFLKNLNEIENGLVRSHECEAIFQNTKIKKGGMEADICCEKDDSIVIIEIKTMREGRSKSISILNQIKKYIEFMKKHEYAKGKKVRGIILAYDDILAHNISEALEQDAEECGDVKLKIYAFTDSCFKIIEL